MIDAKSEGPTTIIALQDITARKQAERELLALNQELEQYAYVVSHDLKAPLRAIHNYTDFIREDLDGQELTNEVRQYLDGLGKAVSQGEDLVEDLLALSRIGNLPGPVSEVDLAELVDEVAKGLDFGPQDRIEASGLPVVRGDVTLLRQIIQNIVSNGLKFNTSNPKVLAVQWRDHGSGGEVTFTDNGIGMEEQYFEQVFRLFQRLHTESEYEGTGVGLAIVKKAAERIGASVSLSSTPGQGSTFGIFFPEKLIAGRSAPATKRRTA
jgi:light-regulated signal transduction histidine kinase (bacteriophytochrome)